MKYVINENSNEHAYMQLYRQLRMDITELVYKYGDKLPSKRMLADETMTSVITVEHAYDILCDEGYVQAIERRGYFVTYKKKEFVPVCTQDSNDNLRYTQIKNNNTDNINKEYTKDDNSNKKNEYVKEDNYYKNIFDNNELNKIYMNKATHNDEEFPFSVYSKTMRNVLSKYREKIYIKPDNQGCYELRQALADYLARTKGIKVNTNQIVIGSGAEYLYGLVVQFFGRDKKYGIENPSYEKILKVYCANGAKCDLLKMGKNGILTSELRRTDATILHVTPFRSFPSGVTASASKREEYIDWANKKKGFIIEDDFDSEFTISKKNEDTVFSLEPKRSVIYINTFSKTIAPSMRVGYMVIPVELLNFFLEKMGFYSCTVPVFEQYVLAELINNGDFERHINRVRRKRRKNLT